MFMLVAAAALLTGCAAKEAPEGSPEGERVSFFRERLATREARSLIAEAWKSQQWPQNHAEWQGEILVYRKGLNEAKRLDFAQIASIRLRDAYEDFDHDYEVVIYGRFTREDPSPSVLTLRADRWSDAAELARAASRLSGVDVVSQLDKGGAPAIQPDAR